MKFSKNIFIIFSLLLFLTVVKSYAFVDSTENSISITESETGEEVESLFSFLGFIRINDSNLFCKTSITKTKFLNALFSLIECISPPIPPPKELI